MPWPQLRPVLGPSASKVYFLKILPPEITDKCHISASNGVVIATEKVPKSILVDEHSVHRVEEVTKHIGMVYSGNLTFNYVLFSTLVKVNLQHLVIKIKILNF
jgi:hypothetical protein